jgi:hypothetical protein
MTKKSTTTTKQPRKEGEHEHRFGPFERSRFAGTVHRKCLEPGCKVISLDDDEGDEE